MKKSRLLFLTGAVHQGSPTELGKSQLTSFEIFLFDFKGKPVSFFLLCHSPCHVTASKGVKNQITGFRQKFDKEKRKLCRETRRMDFYSCFFASYSIGIITRVVSTLQLISRDGPAKVLLEFLGDVVPRRPQLGSVSPFD